MKYLSIVFFFIASFIFAQNVDPYERPEVVLVDSSNTGPSTTYVYTSIYGYRSGSAFISVDDSTTVTVYMAVESAANLTDETTDDWGDEGTLILGAASVSDVKLNYKWSNLVGHWLLFKIVKTANGVGASTNNFKIAISRSGR